MEEDQVCICNSPLRITEIIQTNFMEIYTLKREL